MESGGSQQIPATNVQRPSTTTVPGTVSSENAQRLARHIGGRLPPGWGAVWKEKGCGELAGTPADQFQLVVTYLLVMEIWCALCQV